MLAARLGPIDAKQFSSRWGFGCNELVNALSLSDKVFVKSTDNNATVIWLFPVQGDKMLAVDSEKYPIVSTSKFQNLLIVYALISLACFLASQYAMAKFSEGRNYWQGKILIGV